MDFCTVSDLTEDLTEKALIQLTDDSPSPSAVNAGRCAEVIAQASELMEGRLASKFGDLSALAPTPLLRRICIDICAYYLYSRRNKGGIENIRARYETALKELDSIRLGQSGLPSQDASGSRSCRSSKAGIPRMFTDETWERY